MAIYEKPQDINLLFASEGRKAPLEDEKVRTGWVAEIPLADNFNYYENRRDLSIAYINQRGICEWDNDTTYIRHKSYIVSPSGKLCVAKLDNTGVNPDTDSSGAWAVVIDPETINP